MGGGGGGGGGGWWEGVVLQLSLSIGGVQCNNGIAHCTYHSSDQPLLPP